MKAARNRLIDLLEEHGESFLECKGCSLCSEIKKLRKHIDRDPEEKFKHTLAKGQDLTRTDISFLLENEVSKKDIRQALEMNVYDFNQLMKNLGFPKRGEKNEMARLEMSPAEYVKLKFIEKKKIAEIAAQKNVAEATIYNWQKANADEIEKAKGFAIQLNPPRPVKAAKKPTEGKPTQQDKESEYAALINELSDKVKKQEGIIAVLEKKIEEYQTLRSINSEEADAGLRKEVEYLSNKRLEEKELYLDTLEQLKDKNVECENLKNSTENNKKVMESYVKENQSLRNMVKELVGLWA